MDKPRIIRLAAFILLLFPFGTFGSGRQVLIEAGTYPSFLKQKVKEDLSVSSFWLDSEPVTNAEFLQFVRKSPDWRKSKVKKIFSDSHYLQRWTSDLSFKKDESESPVTYVSWFAADAYCRSNGGMLPSTDQWEYAAYDKGREKTELKERILDWYSRPNETVVSHVGRFPANGFGVRDLFGLVWEWTQDFNEAMGTDDERSDGEKNSKLFCGGGSQIAADPSDYASFMRYEFRNSLRANYAIGNLGFRCARIAK